MSMTYPDYSPRNLVAGKAMGKMAAQGYQGTLSTTFFSFNAACEQISQLCMISQIWAIN
jgi:hypothetical protein